MMSSCCLLTTRSAVRAAPAMGLPMVGVVLGLAGCNQPRKSLLVAPEPPIVWPAPPDQSRVRYIGELTGSLDVGQQRRSQDLFSAILFGPEPASNLVSPHAVAVDDSGDRVAIADTNGPCVHVFDLARRQYTRKETFGSPPQAFACPIAVAWVNGGLWIADAKIPALVAANAAGIERALAVPSLRRPAGMAYSARNETCYVVDSGTHTVLAFDKTGRLVTQFGNKGGGAGQFNFPSHIACGPQGTLAVSDSLNFRVQLFGPDGAPVGMFGRKGDAAGDLSLPKGVALDHDGNVWVVDANFENVQAFTAKGELLMAFGGEGRGPGQFWLPAGICIDQRRRMWIADTYNRRVQVFALLP